MTGIEALALILLSIFAMGMVVLHFIWWYVIRRKFKAQCKLITYVNLVNRYGLDSEQQHDFLEANKNDSFFLRRAGAFRELKVMAKSTTGRRTGRKC